MTIERASWAILSVILAIALGVTYYRYSELRHALLASDRDRVQVGASVRLFSKDQGISEDDVARNYYIAYAGMSDRSCIRLVPKRNMTGGASTYCFTKNGPSRLVSRDEPAE